MKNTMKKTRGFVDPITLGFLLSLVGTTTALNTRDVDQVDTAVAKVEVQAVATKD
ncbi:hypothetical protein MNBD_GAMMA22-2931 [hydrothermal vent metagenome]|uniref:Uncharacterized protein n=1 Tax=hydrothermal vent metagenome TaxID=652676 RepID=A0A3B1AII6_9ZZZZ